MIKNTEKPAIIKDYNHYNERLRQTPTNEFRESWQKKTVQLVRQQHALQNGTSLGENDPIDIAVSYDGSWLTRGHSSMIGIGCVIDVLTGYVLDFHVMSTFSQACQTTGEKPKADSQDNYAA
ncbi:hypothetical protein PoB_003526700 [Plakobranchus ocellatus]|uniref:Mutator-like transposase domain-containing protein n=1 Tax=Plakobranchus ocellatus TaxID=259542 RepID=A0AAV4AP98_9GAST|nr:hypothetical protein PoB_003526700 [Plakobranchus ocellatus]